MVASGDGGGSIWNGVPADGDGVPPKYADLLTLWCVYQLRNIPRRDGGLCRITHIVSTSPICTSTNVYRGIVDFSPDSGSYASAE